MTNLADEEAMLRFAAAFLEHGIGLPRPTPAELRDALREMWAKAMWWQLSPEGSSTQWTPASHVLQKLRFLRRYEYGRLLCVEAASRPALPSASDRHCVTALFARRYDPRTLVAVAVERDGPGLRDRLDPFAMSSAAGGDRVVATAHHRRQGRNYLLEASRPGRTDGPWDATALALLDDDEVQELKTGRHDGVLEALDALAAALPLSDSLQALDRGPSFWLP